MSEKMESIPVPNEEKKDSSVENEMNNIEKDIKGEENAEKKERREREKESELERIRGDIENVSEEAAPKKEEGLKGGMFFKKAKKEEGEKGPSFSEKIAENISNTEKSQEVRDKTAERKVSEVIKALENIYGNLNELKENVGIIIDFGAGWGENLRNLAQELKAEKAIGIDKKTVSSEKVREEMGNKLAWIKKDVFEAIESLKDNSIDLTAGFAFLQTMKREEKVAILKEMGRIAKEGIIIVDELKRNGLDGLKDLFMNKLYNAGMGKYDVLEEKEWRNVFKEAGLVVVKDLIHKFGDNDFVAVLKKIEDEIE